MRVNTSPTWTPAAAAGLPARTSAMVRAPSRSLTSSPSHGASAAAAKLALCTSSRSNSSRTLSIGIAKPMFSAPIAIALLMPISRPVMSSSAPPLLPWLIAASVCSSPEYSRNAPSGVRTRIERSIADSTPLVTVLA